MSGGQKRTLIVMTGHNGEKKEAEKKDETEKERKDEDDI